MEDILAHYGIKGMRWGVRNKVGSDGRITRRSKPKKSSDYKSTEPLRKRPSPSLSNMQLKKVNERMQLESKFTKLNPSRQEKGKKFVDDTLKAAIGASGAAAFVSLFKLAKDPKVQAMVKTGIEVISFKFSPQGRLLNQVRKGRFG